jgi:hypothetical protein
LYTFIRRGNEMVDYLGFTHARTHSHTHRDIFSYTQNDLYKVREQRNDVFQRKSEKGEAANQK